VPIDGVAGEAARVAEERKCGAELRKYVDKNGGDVGWGEKGKRVGWGDVLAGLRRGAQLQRENPLIGELGREKETKKI
jgi:hypothetical protein